MLGRPLADPGLQDGFGSAAYGAAEAVYFGLAGLPVQAEAL